MPGRRSLLEIYPGVGMLEGEGTGIPEDGVVCIPPGHGTWGTDT